MKRRGFSVAIAFKKYYKKFKNQFNIIIILCFFIVSKQNLIIKLTGK